MNNTEKVSKDNSSIVTDEKFNTISHFVAAIFAVMGASLLIVSASVIGKLPVILGAVLYGVSLVALFVLSALHHGIDGSPPVNKWLRKLDYSAIYLLVLGTVSGVVLTTGLNPLLITAWAVIAALAIAGLVVTLTVDRFDGVWTSSMYISIGWLPVVILFFADLQNIWLLFAGGVMYTVGFIIYALEKPNLKPGIFAFHELWHIFVIAGASFHYWYLYKAILAL